MTTQTEQSREDWLKGLAVGDEVAVEEPGMGRDPLICKVERVTDSQVIVPLAGPIRYHRSTGRGVGLFKMLLIYPVTPSIMARLAHKERVAWFNRLNVYDITPPVLDAMHAAYIAALKAAEEGNP